MPDYINYENKRLLETYFSGHFDILPETIIIVVGTWIGNERYDRALAMLIKRILSELNIESDIITDVFYYEKIDKFLKNHTICIGSGRFNKVTNAYEMREKSGLNRNETTTKIFVEDDRNIAFVYGRGVKETYEATRDFCKYNLNIPINLDELLKNIVYTPSRTVSNDFSNDLKVDKLSNQNGLKQKKN